MVLALHSGGGAPVTAAYVSNTHDRCSAVTPGDAVGREGFGQPEQGPACPPGKERSRNSDPTFAHADRGRIMDVHPCKGGHHRNAGRKQGQAGASAQAAGSSMRHRQHKQ